MKTFQEFCEAIQSLELKYRLYDIKYRRQYPVWPYYRIYFYFRFFRQKGLFEAPSKAPDITFRTVAGFSMLLLRFGLIRLILGKRKEYLIIENSRKRKGVDIHSEDVRKEIEGNCHRLSFSDGFSSVSRDITCLDTVKVGVWILSKILLLFYQKDRFAGLKGFLSELGCPDEWSRDFHFYYQQYALYYKFYRLLLSRTRPKAIFLVAAVYYTPLLAAASKFGIPTIELQHGSISRCHLAYQYPGISGEGFFPDVVFTFSDFWSGSADFPLNTEIIAMGNNYYYTPVTSMVKKIRNRIIFISQGTIGKSLEKFILRNRSVLEGYEVIYKLHPAEYSIYIAKYPGLIELANAGKLKIIGGEKSLREIQQSSEFQIGAYSTAIYEGLTCGCKTILLNVPGIENMAALIERAMVHVAGIEDKFSELLEKARQLSPVETVQFFNPFDPRKLENFLERL